MVLFSRIAREKNKKSYFSFMLVFISIFKTAEMKDFQTQHGEVWWGRGR
jgi:hypothetical protein